MGTTAPRPFPLALQWRVSSFGSLLDPAYLIQTFSYLGLFLIIFAETGLLVGFFLPGDTLLLTGGVFAAHGDLSLWAVCLACFVGAVLGNSVGYWIGWRFGPAVFSHPESRLFRPEYVERARAAFERYGALALVVSRFVPIVRTFVPTMAGAGRMNFTVFTLYNLLGALLWTVAIPVVGYALGQIIPPDILDRYILLLVGAVVVVSLLGVGVTLLRRPKNRA